MTYGAFAVNFAGFFIDLTKKENKENQFIDTLAPFLGLQVKFRRKLTWQLFCFAFLEQVRVSQRLHHILNLKDSRNQRQGSKSFVGKSTV